MTVIRPATPKDLPQLADLVRREADWVRTVSAKLRRSDTQILVAEQDDHLVGFINVRVVQRGQRATDGWLKRMVRRLLRPSGAEPDSILQPMRFGFIEDVYVAPALRNQGIATALFRKAETDCQHSVLTVGTTGFGVPFYQAMGMHITGKRPVTFGPLEGEELIQLEKKRPNKIRISSDPSLRVVGD